jgi:hypothetical protein
MTDYMKKHLLASLLILACCLTATADRYQSLLNAKHLTIITDDGTTMYYLLSADAPTITRLHGESVTIGHDEYAVNSIKSMRIENIPRFVLDEDNAVFDKKTTASHALLALRKTLYVNQWNPIVLPVELTGEQVRDAFGEDAMVATVRGFRQGDNTVVEYETVNLDTRDVAMLANVHYIIRPTRNPDLAEGKTAPLFGNIKPTGPLYLIPTVSLSANQSPKIVFYSSDDNTVRVMEAGTYVVRDGSTSSNKLLTPGYYYLGSDGLFSQPEESTAIKAFNSWYTITTTEKPALRFYIDGINEDLTEQFLTLIENNTQTGNPASADQRFDMQGRRVGSQLKPGLYIINGKKTIVK